VALFDEPLNLGAREIRDECGQEVVETLTLVFEFSTDVAD
jgi:hypothetical protein